MTLRARDSSSSFLALSVHSGRKTAVETHGSGSFLERSSTLIPCWYCFRRIQLTETPAGHLRPPQQRESAGVKRGSWNTINNESPTTGEKLKLATSATIHCLLGCGLGEVVGVVIGTALALSTVRTIVLAVSLGFVFGMALGLIPLLKAQFTLKDAVRQVLIAEGLSIAVMETVEVLVEVYTPSVMAAGLTSWLFWGGMSLALLAGFIAAFPVNYVLVGKGIRHIH